MCIVCLCTCIRYFGKIPVPRIVLHMCPHIHTPSPAYTNAMHTSSHTHTHTRTHALYIHAPAHCTWYMHTFVVVYNLLHLTFIIAWGKTIFNESLKVGCWTFEPTNNVHVVAFSRKASQCLLMFYLHGC